MLHILLTILKIIGIILLVVLGLIVLLVVCILFVPIRYKADIIYNKNDTKPKISVRITYLLRILSFNYDWNQSSVYSLRIFGIKTHFLDKEKKEKNKKYDDDTKMFEEMNRSKETVNDKTVDKDNKDVIEREKAEKSASSFTLEEEKKIEKIIEDKEDIQKESLVEKITKKIKQLINKIKYRFMEICGTIKKIYKNVKDFKTFITDERTKEAFYFVKKEIFILLKHIRPRKIRGYVHYGFDDPSVTGKVLGLIYMLGSGTHKNFQINADFEDKVLEGEVHVRGYVQVYVILIIALRLYKNDNLRDVLERRRTYGRE